jgi:hypothetical protein
MSVPYTVQETGGFRGREGERTKEGVERKR